MYTGLHCIGWPRRAAASSLVEARAIGGGGGCGSAPMPCSAAEGCTHVARGGEARAVSVPSQSPCTRRARRAARLPPRSNLWRKRGGSGLGQLALRRPLLSARSCSGLPRAPASLGQPAAWAALAGHASRVLRISSNRRWPTATWPDCRRRSGPVADDGGARLVRRAKMTC